FSADKLAAIQPTETSDHVGDGEVPKQTVSVEIFEVPTGRTVASVDCKGLYSFSQDGKLILDRAGDVWDVKTAKRRFHFGPARGLSQRWHTACFVLAGRGLAYSEETGGQTSLIVCDAETGMEIRRVALPSALEGPLPPPICASRDGRL